MKKTVILISFLISIVCAVFIYNRLITDVDREIRGEAVNQHEQGTKISFLHWVTFPDSLFSGFHKQYPDITVNFERVGRLYYHDVQKLRIASGARLDVMGVLRNDYRDFIIMGYLENLSEAKYMQQFEEKARKELAVIPLNRKEYAIPYRSWVMGVWYNRILFNKYDLTVPKNYSEFVDTCRVLKNNGVAPLLVGARDEEPASSLFLLRFCSLFEGDTGLYDKIRTGLTRWDDSAIADAMKDIQQLIDEEYVGKQSVELTYHQAFQEFLSGGSAMILMPDDSISLIGPDAERVCEPGVFPIPYERKGEVPLIPGNEADALIGIYSRSNEIEAADKLLSYLASREVADSFTRTNLFDSPVRGLEPPEFKYSRLWQPIKELEMMPVPMTEFDSEFLKVFNRGARDLLAGTCDYKQLLEKFRETQEALLHAP